MFALYNAKVCRETTAKTFQSISTVTLTLPSLSHEQEILLEKWLRSLLWEKTLPTTILKPDSGSCGLAFEIHRTKGLFEVKEASWRVIQGVRDVFEIREIENYSSDKVSQSTGKIVLIGLGLEQTTFQSSLDNLFKEYLV